MTKIRVALIRGPFLRPNGVLPWQYVHNNFRDIQITAFSSIPERFDTSMLKMPVTHLYWLDGKIQLLNFLLRILRLPRNVLLGVRKALDEFDLIHVSENFHFFSLLCALLSGKRSFLFTQDQNIPYPIFQHNIITWLSKQYVNRRATLIIATTELGKRALIHEGVDDTKIRILPNSADTNTFYPSEKCPNKVGLPDELKETFNILFVGEPTFQKGFPWLIKAFRQLEKEQTDIRLIVVGNIKKQYFPNFFARRAKNFLRLDYLEKLMLTIKKERNIFYIGQLRYDRMVDIYNLSDVLVLPSIVTRNNEEQFGMVILEAMSCAKPTIVTNVGGMPWVVEKNKTSFVIPYKSAGAIKESVQRIYSNPDMKDSMGGYSRKFVEQHYSVEVVGKKLYNIYKQMK